MKPIEPLGKTYIYNEAPKDSAIRMECRRCGARPGDKCKTDRGVRVSYFHDVRMRDLGNVRSIEMALDRMNARYAKGGAA